MSSTCKLSSNFFLSTLFTIYIVVAYLSFLAFIFLVLFRTFCSSYLWIALLELILILYDNYVKCPEESGFFFETSIQMARILSLWVSKNCKQNLLGSANRPTPFFLGLWWFTIHDPMIHDPAMHDSCINYIFLCMP